jgi:hypothetical protein
MGNKLFLQVKQNVSICETTNETTVFKVFQSAYFEPNIGSFWDNFRYLCIADE